MSRVAGPVGGLGAAGNGAVEGRNLEPEVTAQLLSDLEEWSDILKAEPEVIHRLEAFAAASDAGAEGGVPWEDEPPARPDLPEPGL